jgi:hypothetical protein
LSQGLRFLGNQTSEKIFLPVGKHLLKWVLLKERTMASTFYVPRKPTPLPRCYWVVEDLLLAGAYPGKPDPIDHRKRLKGLVGAGMRTFISLMEPHEKNNDGTAFVPYICDLESIAKDAGTTVDCKNYPIVDRSITTIESMRNILDAIDESIHNKRPVYVHCYGGIGRTGTVICCWLLRHRHATSADVLHLLNLLRQADQERSWRTAPENDQQIQFALAWPRHDRSKNHRPPVAPPATGSDWFTKLVGFSERSGDEVRTHLRIDGDELIADPVGKAYTVGKLETPSLSELRSSASSLPAKPGKLRVSQIVGDVQDLHKNTQNAGALFQVASQFNLLEMVSPSRTPEHGVGIYQNDRTQGPACAIACGAGTIYRNYFVDLGTQIGQTKDRQINCLEDLGLELGNQQNRLWQMQNGYALATESGLRQVAKKLSEMTPAQRESLMGKLRIGVQWDTQVTLAGCSHLVTQAYCSALPVAYSPHSPDLWEPFARLILEAAYESTFLASLINASQTKNRTVYLTSLGGGAFGNASNWIYDAMRRSIQLFSDRDLDVKLVSYGASNPSTQRFIASLG